MSTNFLMPLMMLVGPEGDQARKSPGVSCAAALGGEKNGCPKNSGSRVSGVGVRMDTPPT